MTTQDRHIEELLLHRGGEPASFLDAGLEDIAEVGIGNGVGHIGRDLRIFILISDGQQIGVGIAFDLEMLECYRCIPDSTFLLQ